MGDQCGARCGGGREVADLGRTAGGGVEEALRDGGGGVRASRGRKVNPQRQVAPFPRDY